MHRALVLAVLVFNAAQTSGEPPAALRRPNLQVLKTIPESQLFPLMNALSDSLGVRCDYCHVRVNPDPAKTWSLAGGWLWDRDDKPTKLIAREMIRMMRDINQRQALNGAKVTCFTCHRGSTVPARFPPLPPREFTTGGAPAARSLPSADAVWNAYVAAVGGDAAANGFATTVMSAPDERSEGRRGRIEVTFKGSDRMRVTLQVPPDGPVSQALNQDGGWVSAGETTRALSAEEVARVRRGSVRYGVIKLARPADLRITGIERVGDREAYVAESEVNAPRRTAWFFDTESGLLLRERTTTETELLPLQEQIDYEDYRRVDGVTVPFRTRSSDGSPFSTSVRTWTIRHDVPVDDAIFQMPVRPDLAGELGRIAASAPGTLGVRVVHVETGAAAGINDQDWYPMMSAYKLPIAVHVLRQAERGALNLSSTVTLGAGDRRPGLSPLARTIEKDGPQTATLRDLLSAIVRVSDNTASDRLLREAGGPAAVAVTLRELRIGGIDVSRYELEFAADYYGVKRDASASLESFVAATQRTPPAARRRAAAAFLADRRDSAQPRAFAELLARLVKGELLNTANTAWLLGEMTGMHTRDTRLRAGLPAGTPAGLRPGTSGDTEGIRAAHNDNAIVTLPDGTHLVIAAFLKGSRGTDARRDAVLASVARVAYRWATSTGR